MNRFRSLVFPLSLALILGGLTAWLGQISEVVVEEIKLNPNQPQYHMSGIKARRFDDSGSLNQMLTAPSAWQLPDKKDVFLETPLFELLQQDKAQYSVRSQEARYELESKKVFFNQNVVLNKTADAERSDAEVKTDYLEVDTQTEIASTSAPVAYRYGRSQGTANGLVYDNKNEQLNLPSRVKAIIYDAK